MIALDTPAEERAQRATILPEFRKVALAGIKEQVAQMLDLIGRTQEIFATYTRHDINHVNVMLRHLEWLIPPETRNAMTPVDWLLATMAIYFHDLGMVVTASEFETRLENEDFTSFLDELLNDPKSIDYRNRAKRMTDDERDRFFFQEFIRETHPRRVREWITGRHSRHWGPSVKPIASIVARLMEPLPGRFRENLALVCESHHLDNLNRIDLYPLCQRYGNDNAEVANVQYAALLLRTVDLLHVTKDRTPSVTYRTIKFSDPKSVEEWDKQKDTFAVRHAGREFDPTDESTHIVIVSADFTEERPFFALTEYLSWADAEIKRSRRWSEQSRLHKDGERFDFPWQGVRGDLRVEGNQPAQMRFEFDRGRLLDLLVGHAIYNDATVALRELLQNAIDAVRFQYYLDNVALKTPLAMGRVSVTWDSTTRALVVQDDGTGMDLDVIHHHLMKVGSSYYDTPQFSTEFKTFTPISRFGIGILTCFMISDDIEIVTFKYERGYRIRMSSVHADYLLRELPRGSAELVGIEPHGTRVALSVREGVDLSERSIEGILRHWVVLPACVVEFNEVGQPSTRIGFQSPSEALESYYAEARKEQPRAWQDVTIVTKRRSLGGGTYELAVAVEASWYPEKSFAKSPRPGLPAVCIEGIRVADHLPDCSDDPDAIAALVSIRDVRDLRTTVSRAGLEVDEEHHRLGRICVEMLAEHVRDEIARLASAEGKPLSRASSGGHWLSEHLVEIFAFGSSRDHMYRLRRELPLIVMERAEAKGSETLVERVLVSPQDLGSVELFWTIESRLVDSLGVISRDLGREVSLQQFLASLAPEDLQIGHSPILPDVLLFRADVEGSHHPAVVEFSRRYQQTAIKWTRGAVRERESVVTALREQSFRVALREEANKRSSHRHVALETGTQVAAATVAGDERGVSIVRSRVVTIVEKSSELAGLLASINAAVSRSADERQARDLVVCLELATIYGGLLVGKESRDGFGSLLERDYELIWKQLATEVNVLLTRYSIEGSIPESVPVIAAAQVFDASDYWRDWHRR